MSDQTLFMAVAFFAVALIYSLVGHAGATGYLAIMALVGIDPILMKSTALTLNIVVASVATLQFYRRGAFSYQLFVPLACASIPMAYLGGYLTLPASYYKPVIGLFLLYAAWRALNTAGVAADYQTKSPTVMSLIAAGAILGFLSGLTGVGGGVFLSPLMLLMRWAPTKVISGTAAAFILVNSIAGMLGVLSTSLTLAPELPLWAITVLIAGLIGAEFGSGRLRNSSIQRVLSFTLFIAGLKMLAHFVAQHQLL